MATTADIKNGLCLELNGKLFSIVQFQHVKPGKGPAFVRTKLRNLENGKVVDYTFTAGVKIDVIRVERRPYQFLYKDDSGYNFMHQETFEQTFFGEELIDNPQFLKEGQYVEVTFHAENETPLSCELPIFITLEVTYTENALKSDSSSSAVTKPATLETGANIQVPLFVNIGDKIKIDTRELTYVERVKE